MPILNDFCDALNQAISDYENEVKSVPMHRQQEIQTLRANINQCLQAKMDAVEFREEIVEYTKNISGRFWAFIPAFDSRLRKHLLAVLNQNRFSEKKLASKERSEDRLFYRTEINDLRTQITTLTDALAVERAKDNVQRVNELMGIVLLQKQTIDLLTARNEQLLGSLKVTVGKYETSQTDDETLSNYRHTLNTQYGQLFAEQEKTLSIHQAAKPVNASASVLFN